MLEKLARLGKEARQGHKEKLAKMVLLALQVLVDPLVQWDLLVPQDPLVQLAHQVHQDQLVAKVTEEILEVMDPQVSTCKLTWNMLSTAQNAPVCIISP